jgi:hypothetical protein
MLNGAAGYVEVFGYLWNGESLKMAEAEYLLRFFGELAYGFLYGFAEGGVGHGLIGYEGVLLEELLGVGAILLLHNPRADVADDALAHGGKKIEGKVGNQEVLMILPEAGKYLLNDLFGLFFGFSPGVGYLEYGIPILIEDRFISISAAKPQLVQKVFICMLCRIHVKLLLLTLNKFRLI